MTLSQDSSVPAVRFAAPYELPVYPFVPPPEIGSRSPTRHRVVIVGAGLSGLTLALELAVHGVRSVVLDEDDTVGVRGASSRGICYAQKSLEIFDRLGLYERIRERGITWSRGRTLSGDDEVYSFELDPAAGTGRLQPAFINLQQFILEGFLVERIAEVGLAEIRWKNRVTDVQAQADGVRLQVDTPAGGYALQADWLIDASGANSLIRRSIGARGSESHSDDRWCISDVRFRQPKPMERWTWVDAPFNEDRGVWQHLMADDVWRLDYQMAPDADPQAVSRPEVVAERVRRQLGDDVDFEFVWIGPYQYRDHLLDDFRHERLFFIGDAAHVVSPFGARGGNNGIQDAANLGWKLAAVLRGFAADTLLDSYGAERRAAAVENLEVTRRTARFLAPRSAAERDMRRAVLALARDHSFARPLVNTGRMAVANDYPHSACLPEGARSVRNLRLAFVDGTQTSLNELLRGDPRLLGLWFDPPEGLRDVGHPALEIVSVCSEQSGQAAVPSRARCLLDDGRLAAELGARAGTLCLLRPDGYVAATLPGADPDRLQAAFERILPQATGRPQA